MQTSASNRQFISQNKTSTIHRTALTATCSWEHTFLYFCGIFIWESLTLSASYRHYYFEFPDLLFTRVIVVIKIVSKMFQESFKLFDFFYILQTCFFFQKFQIRCVFVPILHISISSQATVLYAQQKHKLLWSFHFFLVVEKHRNNLWWNFSQASTSFNRNLYMKLWSILNNKHLSKFSGNRKQIILTNKNLMANTVAQQYFNSLRLSRSSLVNFNTLRGLRLSYAVNRNSIPYVSSLVGFKGNWLGKMFQYNSYTT